MRIAFYNQMFALDGTSALSNIAGHWAVHFQSDAERIWKRADLARTYATVTQADADVVGIAEVLEGQDDLLRQGLAEMGYPHVAFGRGHRTMFRKLTVQVAIASRTPLTQVEAKGFPMRDVMGGGGGFAHCEVPALGAHVLVLHLAGGMRGEQQRKQLEFLEGYVARLQGKVILMGDFNITASKLEGKFLSLSRLSDERVTCSTTPGLRLLCAKDLDHIFARGFSCMALGDILGPSDHKLIYADLVPE